MNEEEPDVDFEAGVARLVAREREMLAAFEGLPAIDIHALTGSLGGGALGSPKTGLWALRLVVGCWREPGGPRRDEAIFVRRIVSDEPEIDRLVEALQPHTLVKLRVRLKEIAPGARFGLLDELLDPPEDAELAAIAAERAELERVREAEQAAGAVAIEPADVDDERFGKLRFDAALSRWATEARWSRRPVRLELPRLGQSDAADSLVVARTLFSQQKLWASRLVKLIDTDLLGLKNDTWLSEDERPFTARRFKTRIRLQAIQVFADGRFEFWFSDDDLFGGHDIRVTGRLAAERLEFSLVG